jgi:hypothetical protein
MKVPFCVAFLLVGTISVDVWAQHRGTHAAPHGGAGVHPGAIQPGHGMTPQQQHMMHQQQMMEQRMLYEIMGWSTPSRSSSRSKASSGRSQPSAKQSQRAAVRNNPAVKQQPAGTSQQSADAQKRSSNSAKSKTDKRVMETKKTQHAKNAANQKDLERKAFTPSKLPLAADQTTIGLLRTAHAKLREADHDYDGHRVRAMEHVSSAIRHLHPALELGSFFAPGLGNLPQGQSDQILRDSLVKLRLAEGSLPAGAGRLAHHNSTRTSVTEAIDELELALRTR